MTVDGNKSAKEFVKQGGGLTQVLFVEIFGDKIA